MDLVVFFYFFSVPSSDTCINYVARTIFAMNSLTFFWTCEQDTPAESKREVEAQEKALTHLVKKHLFLGD